MRRLKLQYLTIHQLTLIVYFTLSMVIFIYSIYQGKEGVEVSFFAGGDGLLYWKEGKNVAAGLPWIRTSIYPLVIGLLMKYSGLESVFLIRLFNYFGFILLVTFSIKLLRTVSKLDVNKDSQSRTYIAQTLLLMCFLLYASLQVYINFSILRDVWIYLLYVLSIYLSIKVFFFRTKRFLYLLALIPSVWLLGEFRAYVMLSFCLSMGIYFFVKRVKAVLNYRSLAILIIGAFAVYFTFFIDFSVLGMSLRGALNYRTNAIDFHAGGSQMWIRLDQPNILLFLVNYFHSFVGNLIGPLPWHISGMSTLIIFLVETIPMIFILSSIWKGRKSLSDVQRFILLHGFVWIGLIGFSNDNIGTASRLRPVAWILFLIVFVYMYSSKDKRKSSQKREEVINEDIANN